MKSLILAFYNYVPWRLLDRWVAYSERRRLLDRDLETHRDVMHGHLLEIGAGRGGRRGRFRLESAKFSSWWTLDVKPNIHPHLRGNVVFLPFAANSFNTVICLEVLEYLRQPQAALIEINRVMCPGGVLIISVPFLHRADDKEDRWRPTVHGLCELLTSNGFMIESVQAQGAALTVIANIIKFIVNNSHPGPMRILLATIIWLPVMILRALDAPFCNWIPALMTFSTGYLVTARPVVTP